MLAEPSAAPLHDAGDVEATEAVMFPVLITPTPEVAIHPLESVTRTVYEPAASPVAVEEVELPGVHKYVYGLLPPLTDTEACPLGLPQDPGILPVDSMSGAACGIIAAALTEHPFASVMFTV